eukprot:5432361-Amphidinium_carterae.2
MDGWTVISVDTALQGRGMGRDFRSRSRIIPPAKCYDSIPGVDFGISVHDRMEVVVPSHWP